jgi:hypothetical protein
MPALALKPQDVLVLLKLAISPAGWTFPETGVALGMSRSEVHGAVKRAQLARLMNPKTRQPSRLDLLEYLLHGVRFSFPGVRGPLTRGMPTAHSAPPLKALIVTSTNDAPVVWPDPKGEVRGEALEPLYRSVPGAARHDARLYELLALVDALRVGRARERAIASTELQSRLSAP